ncbi:Lipase 4 [Erysiphe neolycopersici]|uniref:Lipase 4 n=1 Tax=Erysiphe neolycopersici TaxID=212602 RepID=A0A420HIJ5_9PEZI|nr:Lipase 4 [Erysiphe neolycopersici]
MISLNPILAPLYIVSTPMSNLVNRALSSFGYGLDDEQRALVKQFEEKKQALLYRLKNSVSAEQWKDTAKQLDVLENNEAWKFDNESNEFDAPLIEMRLSQLNQAREAGDIKQMMSSIRTTLSRDLGGMGNVLLYTHSYIGTKHLIERYIDSTLATIRSIVRMTKLNHSDGIDVGTILEQVLCARQAFGRSALLLSGGGTCGMNHIGVLKALFDANSLPRIISGSSAGSIVCSVLCTKTDAELPELLVNFAYGDLAVFTEHNQPESILEKIQRLLTQGFWIDNKHLIRVMKDLLGDMTFQEAYNRTRRILNIFVSSASIYELPRLLNYITSPNVIIWSAVAASCSVPLIFAAANLLVKDPITGEYAPWNLSPPQFIDGSVEGDVPMARLAEMFNVNHFIVCQVNPHVMPFLLYEERATTQNPKQNLTSSWASTLTKLAKDEVLHRLHMLAEIGVFPTLSTKLNSVLSQKYSGDITILPEIELKDLPLILTNPTPEFMERAFLCGERATWPKLSRIRNACAVELELDSAVQALRACLVFGNDPTGSQNFDSIKQNNFSFKVRQKRGYSTTTPDMKKSLDHNKKESLHRRPAHWLFRTSTVGAFT